MLTGPGSETLRLVGRGRRVKTDQLRSIDPVARDHLHVYPTRPEVLMVDTQAMILRSAPGRALLLGLPTNLRGFDSLFHTPRRRQSNAQQSQPST